MVILLRITIDFLNISRDLFLCVHRTIVKKLDGLAQLLEADNEVPSGLKYVLFNNDFVDPQ